MAMPSQAPRHTPPSQGRDDDSQSVLALVVLVAVDRLRRGRRLLGAGARRTISSTTREVRGRHAAIHHGDDARRRAARDRCVQAEECRRAAPHDSHSTPVQQGDVPRRDRARRVLRVARLRGRRAGRAWKVRVRRRVPRVPGRHDRLVRHVRLDREATVDHRTGRNVRLLLPRGRTDRRRAAAAPATHCRDRAGRRRQHRARRTATRVLGIGGGRRVLDLHQLRLDARLRVHRQGRTADA